MRIIAGELKGRRLRAPTWTGMRPTSGRLRETLFALLGARVAGANVVDGCAGTGAVGLEALSRGAAAVTFVESDRRAAALIRANLARCGLSSRGRVVEGALPAAIERVVAPAAFDLVLLDPPYAFDDRVIGAILSALARRTAPDGLLVVERPRRREPLAARTSDGVALVHARRVTAGDSALDLYRRGGRGTGGG